MPAPTSTYRIQFNPQFGFRQAERLGPYLQALGIGALYASPITRARRGSLHGYDVADQNELNPELGAPEEFERLSDSLRERGIGWIQDFVPNHMAFGSENRMLVEVLENGPASRYYDWFDIDWEHHYEGLRGKVLAPFLGRFYAEALEAGELVLSYDREGLWVSYFGMRFPLCLESYQPVLTYASGRLGGPARRATTPTTSSCWGCSTCCASLPAGEEFQERYDQITFIKRLLWELYAGNPEIRAFLNENLVIFNGRAGEPASFDLLDRLLAAQYFRLAFWKAATEELNYRRFFTINDLISLRMELREVFVRMHELIVRAGGAGPDHRAADRPHRRAVRSGELPAPAPGTDRRALPGGGEDPRARR